MPAKAPNESNFHHFVPKSALRRFTVDGAGKQIWVFEQIGRAFVSGRTETHRVGPRIQYASAFGRIALEL